MTKKKSTKKTVKKKTSHKKKVVKKTTKKNVCANGGRIKTHIPNFDKIINGGFKVNTINLIAGNPGTGKTIFASQFLINGILKDKEPAIYITFEEKKENFYKDMACFGYNLEELEKKKMFAYLEYSPEQVRNVLVEGGGVIDSLISKMKAKRIVIDSITSFSLLYDDELSKKEAALSLFGLINKWNCTALLTSQNEIQSERDVKVSLEFEVDTLILMYNSRVNGSRQRGIEVLKMRRSGHSQKTYGMEITNKGLKIKANKIIKLSK